MFTDALYEELLRITNEERWTDLLPCLYQKVSCPSNIQSQASKMLQTNLALLLRLRDSSRKILISPLLRHARGVIDYVVGNTIVELKTSETIYTQHIYQVALYTFAARRYGIYGAKKILDAVPALHYARYGVIMKVPMPKISAPKSSILSAFYPISKLVKNQTFLECIFDIDEVQETCTVLEARLVSKGLQVPITEMTPAEKSALGTLTDVLVKMVLTRNLRSTFQGIVYELAQVALQLGR